MIRILRFSDPGFNKAFQQIQERSTTVPPEVLRTVESIIQDVRERGDAALMEYTHRFDRLKLGPENIEVTESEIEEAYASLNANTLQALELAKKRIVDFHQRQKEDSWLSQDMPDIQVGQKVTPLDRVGIYVPGGKAAYPSSVLMNALPAKVAGVGEVIMVVPMPGGLANPYVLAAARLSGVDRIFKIGGAQAVAALAYGTQSIPKVDKITGPGNIFVATAKRLVFGTVDIDMIAGPSEILVINDGSGEPAHIAADLLSQAEHDELAASILITTDENFGQKTAHEVARQLEQLSRESIARQSISNYGAVIVVDDLAEAARLSNLIAPEHLELAVEDPFSLLDQIRHAGAIFLGHHTPEAAGDYLAGPNHTLPTGGTARFFSPLGTEDFVKKSSLISLTKRGLEQLGHSVMTIAELEGLDAHARSVSIRLES